MGTGNTDLETETETEKTRATYCSKAANLRIQMGAGQGEMGAQHLGRLVNTEPAACTNLPVGYKKGRAKPY